MAIDPKLRSAGLHLGNTAASVLATAMWLSSHSVDLYGIIDQINAVVADIAKLVATISAFAAGAYQVWKSTQKGLVADVTEIAKQPDSPVKAVITENTPAGLALASSIPGPVIPAGTVQAEMVAKATI